MHIKNIEAGQIHKNYKELCEVLNVPIKSGKSKQIQLEEFKRYFDYDKQGNKFIITKIHTTIKRKTKKQTGRKLDIHTDLVRGMILDDLNSSTNNGHMFMSTSKILRTREMINQNYSYAKNKQVRFAKYIDMGLDEIQEFFETSESMLKRSIESALNSLQNESLIHWNHAITVCKANVDQLSYNSLGEVVLSIHEDKNEFDEITSEAELNMKGDFIHRKATDEEYKLIVGTRRKLMVEKYDCKDLQELFRKNLQDKFYKELRQILKEEANIHYFYNSYEIFFNEANIQEEWSDMMDYQLHKIEKSKVGEEINKSVINKITTNTLNRHKKALVTDISKKSIAAKSRNIMRQKGTYLENQNKLTELLIYNKALSIYEDMNNLA